MNCFICREDFDIDNHRPKRIECGHIFCEVCLGEIIRTGFTIHCPIDQIQDTRLLIDILDCKLTVSEIERIHLNCFDHDQAAKRFRLSRFKPLCVQCNITSNDLVQSSYVSTIPNKLFLAYMKNKKYLSKEIQQVVVGNPLITLKSAIKMMNLITNYCSSSDRCAIDNSLPVTFIDCNTFELQCVQCANSKAVINYLQIFPNPYQIISELIQSSNRKFIYSLVAKNHSNGQMTPNFMHKLFIELVLMRDSALGRMENIGCQSCGKLYHLGARMPMLLSCDHIICLKCSSSEVYCLICQKFSAKVSAIPLVNLYKPPTCIYCGSNKIGLNLERSAPLKNLPYHNYCDCIICTQCMRNRMQCNNCIRNITVNQDYYQKLHMRSVKALLYFKLPSSCEQCQIRPAVFCSTVSFNAICEDCNSGSNDAIKLSDWWSLDMRLLELSGNPVLWAGGSPDCFKDYVSLPINMKREIQRALYYNTPGYTPNLCGRIEILRRFTRVYPITTSDPRVFKVKKEYARLVCTADRPVKIVGVILAGRKDMQRMNSTICYTTEPGAGYRENQIEIASKEDIVFLDSLAPSTYFSISARYPVGNYVFSGKFNLETEIQHEGNRFDFSSTPEINDRYSGPILGLLYTVDY